jgi:hypothetical protein
LTWKLKDRIPQLQQKYEYKAAEARFEYGEMKITKLNHKVSFLTFKYQLNGGEAQG